MYFVNLIHPFYLHIIVIPFHCRSLFSFSPTVAHRLQWRTQEFFSGGGGEQIQLRTEDIEKGDLGR